jgi:type II secretory pathway predicted ATPase ExeA
MYESFYNLRDEPFRLSPDPDYCFKHRSYAKAENYLRYGIERTEGIVMVTGAPGTGKSTLISDLLSGFSPSKLLAGTLVVTRLETDDLFRAIAYAFNLTVEGMDRASVLRCLELFLTEQAQKGKRALLIVDEAQNLPNDQLEDLRLLTNLQMGNRPLLQVFLLGQEGLRRKVREPTLKQLLQRIIAACHLEPLKADETRGYIEQRLEQAHWQGDPRITDEAFFLIHKYSGGIPRRINQLCSRLFLYGAVDEKLVLNGADVYAVLEDFRKELLMPADEQQSLEEMARAYTRQGGTYQPRVVTTSDRHSDRPIEGGKRDAAGLSRAPADRSGRPSGAQERSARSGQAPPERAEPTGPRLHAVTKGSVNEALMSLEDDGSPPLTATRHGWEKVASKPALRPGPTQNQEPDAARAQNQPSLYADARDDLRIGGHPMRARYEEDPDERHDRYDGGHGRSWLTLLLALALLLTSIYAASPLIRDQFGIDIAAMVDDRVGALTGALLPKESTSAPTRQPGDANEHPQELSVDQGASDSNDVNTRE